jgi:Tol biopolymer transport system component
MRGGRRIVSWLGATLAVLLVLVAGGHAARTAEEGLIAFVRADPAQPELGGPLYVIGADGSGLRKLVDLPVQHPGWSPDGSMIAFAHECAIWVVRADGSGMTKVTEGTGRCAATPAWSPDGRRLAFSDVFRRSGVRVNAAVAVVNLDGSGLRHVSRLDDGLFIEDEAPTWSLDGRRIAYQISSIFPAGFRHLPPGYVVSQILVISREGYFVPGPATSPFDVDPTADWVADSAPSWSPDGTRIVFQRTFMRSSDPARSVESALYVKRDTGRAETRVVENAAWPDWSPDGRQLVFTALEGTGPRARGVGLAIARADGSGLRRLTSHPGDEWATWAPAPR